MTEEIAMRREGERLAPIDPVSAEKLAAVPTNVDLLVTVKTPRNVKHFQKAWVLAQKVSEACDWLTDREVAMAWLLIKARHVRYVHDLNNNQAVIIPKSIAWASLDQSAFTRLYNRILYVVTSEIIPGLDEGDLRREIEAMVGIDHTETPPRRKRHSSQQATGAQPAAANTESAAPQATTKGGNHTARGESDTVTSNASQPVLDPAQAGLPKTGVEYLAYATAWLQEAREQRLSPDYIMRRWTQELALRLKCKATEAQRDKVFELYTEVLDDLRVSP